MDLQLLDQCHRAERIQHLVLKLLDLQARRRLRLDLHQLGLQIQRLLSSILPLPLRSLWEQLLLRLVLKLVSLQVHRLLRWDLHLPEQSLRAERPRRLDVLQLN